MPNNIIDKIQLSGVTYDIGGGGGTVSSAITSGDTNAVAGGAVYDRFDEVEQVTAAALNNINDRVSEDEEVTAAALNVLNESLSGKQDTLSAGTGIDITSNVISVTGSTGGKAIEAGRGISVTTGATADTISVSFPISAGTGTNSIKENNNDNIASGQYSHAEGCYTIASGRYSHTEGFGTIANNDLEHVSGYFNVSSSGSSTFGDSGNTLFSVGNGTFTARHNAFEIRQNGDIYITSGNTDIKLQDHLGGGGSGTVSSAITSGDTNAVAGGAVYDRFDEVEQVTAQALNVLNDRLDEDEEVTAAALNTLNGALSGKQDTLSAGTNITIVDNVISAEGGGKAITAGRGISVTTGETADTVSFNLPISANTNNSVVMGGKIRSSFTNNGRDCLMVGSELTTNNGSDCCLVVGYRSSVKGDGSAVIGWESKSVGDSAFVFGTNVTASTSYTFATGYYTIANNNYEHTSGRYNVSNTGSTNADKTLFSVGNGTAYNARHNAFEIRQNGDIYLSSGGTDIKLQDHLGGGGEVSSAITSGDTNAVAGGAVFDAVVYSANTYTTELTFDADGYAENWIVGQSAITIDVSGYASDTSADYNFQNSNGEDLGYAHIYKMINSWWAGWNNSANNCTITTDGDTATTATITDIPSGTVKIRRMNVSNPPKAIISGVTPEIWIKDALDDHKDNTTVHITAAERTYWNNKSNFSGSYNDLTDKPIPDSALNKYSDNPLKNSALFGELRIASGDTGTTDLTITFDGGNSTNYPTDCRQIKVELVNSANGRLIFRDSEGHDVGDYYFETWGTPRITNNLDGSTYELSGSTVIISYPNVSDIARLNNDYETQVISSVAAVMPNYTYVPVVDQVVANTTALGGLSLVKLTQAQYDALATKDNSTLYVIVN